MLKWCAYGKHDVDVSFFYKRKAAPDGLQSRCKSCSHGGAEGKNYRAENKTARRKALIDDLGGKCSCCGEGTYEFLQIDHINNNGGNYRKQMGSKSLNTSDLRKHIADLQVLCANCHTAKSCWGFCPHQNPVTK